ncbi:peptidoglycan D,D-transpeptidase FtsI family protein [Aquimonas sp.]|uniref:peptidoglycan D,D-transpeptidase FtsI family protein n=1 Tax=Aquimonas sp. TaxID=1872588 RepID=UPI0037BF547C
MKPRRQNPNLRLRLYVLAAVLLGGSALLVARAAEMQLLRSEFYQQKGENRFLRDIPIPTSRGMITDRNGEPLAVSTPVASIWANPPELLKTPERIPELAAALGLDPGVLRQRIDERAEREFLFLRRHMNPDDAEVVMALGIPGVNSQREFRRFYPTGDIAAHVLGFTNIDDVGQEGLELAFNDWLTGAPGTKRVIRDRKGRTVENVDLVRPAKPGRDLALSIDRRLQHLLYRELKRALEENQAASGTAVITDVATGEVLAMVNLPTYNPNTREGADPSNRRNRAVTDVFEPGSVIKVFTVAAALETGRYQPETLIETSPGYMPLARHTIRDIRNFGTVDLTRLLTKSSNIAAVKLALDMPNEHLHDVLRRFGFGELSGAGFPGESPGVLTSPRRWGVLEKATISYGYGLSTNALQIALAYAALGNGGVMMPATFVRGGAGQGRSVIDPDLARTLVGMLETVTGPEGSATRARVSGYRVAGKTGTSRRSIAGGYEKRYVSLFAGLVPVSNPRLSMVVVINDPDPAQHFGGLVAAPVFGRAMADALRILDVPPDDVQQWYVAAPLTPMPGIDGELPPEAEAAAAPLPDSGVPE